jgi:hypothetical protein
VSVGRKNINEPQHKIPNSGISGCHLFLKVFFLCFERNATTPKQTIINAESVPILTISASSPRETNPEKVDMMIQVLRISFTGVFVFLFTPLKYSGSKPSRLIEKMTLVNA